MEASNNDLPVALCVLIYGKGYQSPRPAKAEELLSRNAEFAGSEPFLNCATGNIAALEQRLAAEPQFVSQPTGPLNMPPLIAVTHSSLCRLPQYQTRLEQAVRLLLANGADPNTTWTPPHASSEKLSALYGAAGKNHRAGMTRLLLDAGADPNDNESLYHSVESSDSACTRMLLDAGARVERSNALFHALDRNHFETFRLILDHVKDLNEKLSGCTPIHWAIRRRRSLPYIEALVAAGFDASQPAFGLAPHVMAAVLGMSDVAAFLRQSSKGEDSELDEFLAACGRLDRPTAEAVLDRNSALLGGMSQDQLRLLPEICAVGCTEIAKLMVELGWPVDAKGGDWNATSLNLAVFRGDAALTGFLLEHGANWTERHGFNDNVHGTLSYASVEQPVHNGNWLACAQTLVAHGVPVPSTEYHFSAPINEYFAQLRK